jgi:hypothetical protein
MKCNLAAIAPAIAVLGFAQTQIDHSKQIRNRAPWLLATDFAGSDIGQQVNNAFASFPAGKCGTVAIPSGTFTFSTTIYVPSGCTLTGAGRGNDHGPHATKLLYNGPGGTPAVVVGMKSDGSPQYYTNLRDLAVHTLAPECPNDGMLTWNPAAAGANKWQCYDGTSFTAPLPHVAGVLHGQVDPNVLLDGTHVTIERVDVNGGGQDGDINQQGGFHFGIWLNGCEECSVRDSYAFQCDDGVMLGEATNGVLLSQVSARINRRAGFHYRGANHFLCSECLAEANQWWGHAADPSNYGAGIRISNASTGSGRGANFNNTYFEANWVDVMVPSSESPGAIIVDGFSSIRGRFNGGKWTGCNIPDASLVTLEGASSLFVNGCGTTGSFNIANQTITVATTDPFAAYARKIQAQSGGGTNYPFYDLRDNFDSGAGPRLILRTEGPNSTSEGLVLENSTTASAADTIQPSAGLYLQGTRWTGSAAQPFKWRIFSSSGAPSSEDTVLFSDLQKGRHGVFQVASGSTYVTNRVKAVAGQTANLTEWQNSSGGLVAAVRPTGEIQLGTLTQAALGTPANGMLVYCSDCNQDATCTAGGTGALAKRIAGAWRCN